MYPFAKKLNSLRYNRRTSTVTLNRYNERTSLVALSSSKRKLTYSLRGHFCVTDCFLLWVLFKLQLSL